MAFPTLEERRLHTRQYQVRGKETSQEGAYLRLAAAVQQIGIEEPDYFREPCGRWWATICGLDASYLWKTAVGDSSGSYSVLPVCSLQQERR